MVTLDDDRDPLDERIRELARERHVPPATPHEEMWQAISARRRRRISSSLFPLNIGPQTTSSQPPACGCVRIMRRDTTRASRRTPRTAFI